MILYAEDIDGCIKICSTSPMCCTTGHIITVYRSLGLSCIGIAQKLLYVGYWPLGYRMEK